MATAKAAPADATNGDDTLKGTGGDDSLNGLGGDDTLLGKGGSDTLLGGSGDDVLSVKDLNAGDSLDGGTGYDVLQIKKAVDLDFTGETGISLSHIDEIDLGKTSDHLVLANAMDAHVKSLIIDAGSGSDTIDASAATNMKFMIDGGVGADLLISGGKADTIMGGSGNDTIQVTSTSVKGDVIDGGVGNDELSVVGGGSVDLSKASFNSIEHVNVSDDATTLTLNDIGMTVDAGGNAGTIILGGNGSDDITLGVAGQTVYTGYGEDVVHATANTLYDGSVSSILIGSGEGSTLALSGGGTIDFAATSIDNFDTVTLDSSTYTLDMSSYNDSVTVNMGNGNSTLIAGEGYYNVVGGVNGNTVDLTGAYGGSGFIAAGNGVDNVTLNLGDGEYGGQSALTAGGDDVVIANVYGEYGFEGSGQAVLNGGSGNDTLFIAGQYGENGVNMGTNIVGFETVDLSLSQGEMYIDANNQAFHLIGSDFNDEINVHNTLQSIDGGLGDDTVDISATNLDASFVYNGGEGYDSLNVYGGNNEGGPFSPFAVDPADPIVATVGEDVTNVETIFLYSEGGAAPVELHLTNQSDISVFAEGGNNEIDLGTGSGITVYLDEYDNTVRLEDASNVSVNGGEGGDTVYLGTGSNYSIDFEGGEGDNTVVVSDASQFASFGEGEHNTISGSGSDTLEFAGNGAYDLHDVNISGFQYVTVDAGVAVQLTLDDAGYDVDMGDQAATSVVSGEGSDTFLFGAAGQSATGGGGNDTYTVSGALLNSVTITELAEGGSDEIVVTGGGTVSLGAGVQNVETYAFDSGTTVDIGLTVATNPGGYSIEGSNSDDTFVIDGGVGNSPQLFSGVSINGNGNTVFGVGDTLEVATAGVVDLTAAGVTISNIENAVLDAATNLTLTNSSWNVTGSAGVDTITAGSGADTIDGGAGVDNIVAGAGNDVVTVDAAAGDIADGGADHDTLVLSGAAIAAITVDLSAGGDQISTLAGNQQNFEDLDASGVTGFGVTATAGANTAVMIGSAQSDTFIFGAGDANGVTFSGGGGSDVARFTGNNDLTTSVVDGFASFQLDGVGTTLTTNAANLADVTSISDVGANDAGQALVMTDSTDLSAVTVTNIETLTINSGTLTIDQSKLTGVTAITGAGGAQALTVSAGNLNLTSIALSGIETVNLASGGTMTAQAADLTNVTAINGTSGSETLSLLDTTDLSAVQLNNIDTLVFGAAGATITVDQAHLGGVSAITGSSGADVLASGASLDLSDIALTGVETVSLTGAGTSLTADAADLANVTAINGAGGSESLLLNDSTNLSAITFSNLENIVYNGTNLNVTISQATLTGVTSITGGEGAADVLTTAAGTSLDLSGALGISAIEQIQLGSGAANLIAGTMADLAGVTTITGGSGANVFEVQGGNVDLTSIALTGFETIQTDDATGSNLTVNNGDIASVTTISMGGASDILTLTNLDGTMDISAITLTGVETIVLGSNADTTANTLVVDDQLNGGSVVVLNGSLAVTDTVQMVDAGDTIDFGAGVTTSGIDRIILGSGADASDNVLDLTSGNASSLSLVQGGGADDTINLQGGGSFNFNAMGVTGVEFVDTGAAAVTLNLNGGGYDVTVHGVTGNVITAGAGADIFDFTGNFAGDTETINNFVQGSGGDQLDLSDIGVTGYSGERTTDALAQGALTAHGSAFSLATHTLFVDIDGDGVWNSANDLQVHMNGVTDLTAGTDLLVV